MTMFELLDRDEVVAFVYRELQGILPGFIVLPKEGSLFMRTLGVILFFNKRFMSNYTTTIGRTVYRPTNKESTRNSAVATLLHEATHSLDWKMVLLLYLTPQVFALGALLAIFFSPWWLLCLLFLLPLPSFGRTYIEARGYGMTLAARRVMGEAPIITPYLPRFTGPDYYWMMPLKCVAIKWLIKYATRPPAFGNILAVLEANSHGRMDNIWDAKAGRDQ